MIIELAIAFSFAMSAPRDVISAEAPIVVPGGAGHFDFMNVDPINRLVFACHPGKSSFTVINLDTKGVKDVAVGTECNGICADAKGKYVFAGGPGKKLVRVDTKTWSTTGSLDLSGPADCTQYDAKRGVLYVDNDDGTSLWVVNPATMKLTATVEIKEAPEYMEYDSTRDRIFQAIKSSSTVQVINPGSKKVVDEWKLGGLTSPHGLAIDRKMGRVFVAGKNGKLVILNANNGKLLSTVEIVKGSDQIAYDPTLQRVYIPGESKIQIVQISGDSGTVIGSAPVAKDCHRVTIDPKTHALWVAFTEGSDSFVQRFTVKK